MSQTITVYCASSKLCKQVYIDATAALAKEFVANGIRVKYGGGSTGLMGVLADEVIKGGGKVIGVMPEFMRSVEWDHKQVDMLYTLTMAERKFELMENVDGLVALPGGTGTLEELFEAITTKRLGKFSKPIVILNVDGFYDSLEQLFRRMCDDNFISREHMRMFEFVKSPHEVIAGTLAELSFVRSFDENRKNDRDSHLFSSAET